MKIFYRILLVLLICIFGFSAWQFIRISGEYLQGDESYESLEQYISVPEQTTATGETNVPEQSAAAEETTPEIQETEPAVTLPISVDFETLAEINPDIVGWIYIEDTAISYPVVQGEDNEYYLSHLFEGDANYAGCIFLDANGRADFSGQNNVIYGHHLKNGSMFAGIRKYREQSYYDAHPTGLLLTPDGAYEVHFFSGYVASTLESAWKMAFSEEDHSGWLEEIGSKSLFKTAVKPVDEDKILTLSTCSYEFTEARFVLHGLLEVIG